MLAPLQQFICDSCGEVIKRPEDGWIEWLVTGERDNYVCHSFRICHHKSRSPYPGRDGCYNYAHHPDGADMHLHHYYEGKNLRVDRKPMNTRKRFEGFETSDRKALLILRMRLEYPYYEEARLYLKKAIADKFLPADDHLTEEALKCVIEEYNVWL